MSIALGIPSFQNREQSEPLSQQMPTSGALVDIHGRIATDLRVSLTDRCNLRCTYCMPANGLPWLRDEAKLTTDEYVRLLEIAVTRLGITSIRFTGGEPLVSPGLLSAVASASALRPRPEIALTTNGIGLADRAASLRRAGLNRVNVSLDTIDQARFLRITRRDRVGAVVAGLAAAARAGLNPVKVNAVLHPETDMDDLLALLRFCLDRDYQLRVIEQMPLDADGMWDRERLVTADSVIHAVKEHFEVQSDWRRRGSAPAELFRIDGKAAAFGVIASVSQAFCGTCDRTRLTADGRIRSCLFSREEVDVRRLLRDGASDRDIENVWRMAMWSKPAGHGIDTAGFVQPTRPMSAIGG